MNPNYMAWTVGLLLTAVSPGMGQEKLQAQITFKVVDDFGQPVKGMEIAMATFARWAPKDQGFGEDISDIYTGQTNEQGSVTISGKSLRGIFSYGPRAHPGYYRGGGGEYKFSTKTNVRWEPWNPTIELVVKPIKSPIPMYAYHVSGNPASFCEIPVLKRAIGYDLMAHDWVSPYGKGKISDFIFELDKDFASAKLFNSSLAMTFSNKGDGISAMKIPLNTGSQLRLPRYAPEDGYQTELFKKMGRESGKAICAGTSEDQNYFIRVRTVLDEQGRIKSALYGKIYGDIVMDPINSKTAYLFFTYYLNPTPLDRNLEFDPEKNLFKNLSSSEVVRSP